MHRPQQEFTFINVTGSKKSNTRTIKRHVSNQTNRRKRQEAVKQYQESLLHAATSSSSSSPPQHEYDTTSSTESKSGEASGSPDVLDSPDQDDIYQEFGGHRQLAIRQPVQTAGYWPSYVQWALENLPRTFSKPSRADTKKPHKIWTTSRGSSESHIVVSVLNEHIVLHIPRIDDPTDYSRIQWALRTCNDFIRSNYETIWGPLWQDRQWFQGSLLPLGIWRECFTLVVEFIQIGKLQQAFYILNAALSVTPTFFKENHPGLLVAILGVMMYTSQIEDRRLSTLIRAHVTQLSMAHLGPKHPIALLLREQLRYEDAATGRADLLTVAVIDTFADLFGSTHFVPLSFKFGYVRRLLNSGEYDAALASIAILEKNWNTETMPGGQLPKLLAFEKAKVFRAQRMVKTFGTPQHDTMRQDLDPLAARSVELPVFVPGEAPSLQPTDSAILNKLGKHLFLGSHFALALHIYTRIPEIFSSSHRIKDLSITDPDPETLPTTVAHILVDHLQSEMSSQK